VSSAYPNWDGLDGAVGVLDEGHEQVLSTPIDGELDEIVRMPHDSPWPILFALCLSAIFAVLTVEKFTVAAVLGVLLLLTLVGWHAKEPQES
jgi:hypothetical protein